MPRRNSRTRNTKRAHTVSGKRARHRPPRKTILFLERDEQRLRAIYVHGKQYKTDWRSRFGIYKRQGRVGAQGA